MNGGDHLEFLSTSEGRVALLQQTLTEAKAPSELRADSDLCRRSIQRNLSEFSSRGWVRREGGKYEITSAGALVLDEYLETRAKISALDLLVEVANALPDPVELPRLGCIEDVRRVTRSQDEPYRPIHFVVEKVEGGEMEFICGRLPEHDRLLRTRLSETLPDVDSGRMAEMSGPESAPEFGLVVLSDETLMICYDEREIETVVASSDDCFVDWGKTVIQSLARDGCDAACPL